mgnify:CR=1 FL=1
MPDQIIQVKITDGNVDNIKTITIPTQTIECFMFSRIVADKFIDTIKDTRKTGVYILYGNAQATGSTHIYIGLSDNIGERISAHKTDSKTDYWLETIVFTTRQAELNISHIKFFESQLLELTKQTPNVMIVNHNDSRSPNISENDKIVAEIFLNDILKIMKAFNLRFFEKPIVGSEMSGLKQYYYKDKHESKYSAIMVIFNGEYVVLEGSILRKQEMKSCLLHTLEKRKALKKSKLIKSLHSDFYIAKSNLSFNSPSFAASVVSGSNVNGLLVWKDIEGKSLKELGM